MKIIQWCKTMHDVSHSISPRSGSFHLHSIIIDIRWFYQYAHLLGNINQTQIAHSCLECAQQITRDPTKTASTPPGSKVGERRVSHNMQRSSQNSAYKSAMSWSHGWCTVSLHLSWNLSLWLSLLLPLPLPLTLRLSLSGGCSHSIRVRISLMDDALNNGLLFLSEDLG